MARGESFHDFITRAAGSAARNAVERAAGVSPEQRAEQEAQRQREPLWADSQRADQDPDPDISEARDPFHLEYERDPE